VSEIVHITFEKLTGLKGMFEGDFECMSKDPIKEGDILVLRYVLEDDHGFIFSSGENEIALTFLRFENNKTDYLRHFSIGRNFLVSRLHTYGGDGRVKINSQSPN
jgi:hypothetical protein